MRFMVFQLTVPSICQGVCWEEHLGATSYLMRNEIQSFHEMCTFGKHGVAVFKSSNHSFTGLSNDFGVQPSTVPPVDIPQTFCFSIRVQRLETADKGFHSIFDSMISATFWANLFGALLLTQDLPLAERLCKDILVDNPVNVDALQVCYFSN